ncbi:MAG TPA: hypothetical protein VJ455_09205 [Ignavibacteria bacterium]|nr:hypothetical protein [Ignavibacteria bacterium]
MKKIFCLLLILVSAIYTQEFKPEVKVGATIFTGWEFNLDNAEFISKLDSNSPNSNIPFGYQPIKNQFETSKNSFFLERAYINVIASLTPDLKARVTPDVFSFTDGNGKTQYNMGIKFAYIDYIPFKSDNGLSVGFRLGVVPNNWTGTNDNYWGYRGFQKTFTDFTWTTSAVKSGNSVIRTQSSFFSTADLGFQINFNAPNGIAELQAAVVNGNGYRNLSFDNRFKDLFFTAFVHPLQPSINKKLEELKKAKKERLNGLADLTFGGFVYMGKLDKGENHALNGVQYERNRFGGMAHLRYNFKKAGFIKIGGEYSVQKNVDPVSPSTEKAETNSGGFSTYLEFNPPVQSINDKLMLIFRYDSFDPDVYTSPTGTTTIVFNNSNDKQSLLIGGFVFKPNKLLQIGLTYQSLTFEDNFVVKYDGTTSKTDGKLFVHGVLNF